MLRVYDKNATDFNNNGLAVIDKATNILISRELNGEFKLSFDLPVDSGKWQYLKQRNIVLCEGQRFRIYQKSREKAGTITRRVECLHIITDASQKHISYLSPQIGRTARNIMLTAFSGTAFNIMTESEIAALGMQWLTGSTDIMESSKITPLDIIKMLIENLQKGELYIDNYNIALVERIGKDTGLYCTLANNLQSLGDYEEGSNIITRLYAYGKDGLPLPTNVAPNGYIDSATGIANYGICEGFKDYDTVDDPNELYQKALWEFSPDNPMRIDMPDFSYSAKLVELYKLYNNNFKVNLGDSLVLKSNTMGIDVKQRIVKYNYYPYSPRESDVTFGRPPKTYVDVIKSTASTSAQYQKTITQNGQVKTSWMENLIGNLQQKVYAGLKKELSLHRTGDLWEFGNDTAIAIVDGVLAIANNRNSDGTWNFRTFATGSGFTADEMTSGTINAINIIGSLITGATINGGYINVQTDVNIGKNLYLGNVSGDVHKGVYMYKDGTIGSITIGGGTDGLTITSKENVTLTPATDRYVNIKQGGLTVSGNTILNGSITTQGQTGISGIYTIGTSTVIVRNGLVTNIL